MTKATNNTAKGGTHARPVTLVPLANCVLSKINPRQDVPDNAIATLAMSILTDDIIVLTDTWTGGASTCTASISLTGACTP